MIGRRSAVTAWPWRLGSADLAAPIAKAFLSNFPGLNVLRQALPHSDWNRVFLRRLQLGVACNQGFPASLHRPASGGAWQPPTGRSATLIRATRGSGAGLGAV